MSFFNSTKSKQVDIIYVVSITIFKELRTNNCTIISLSLICITRDPPLCWRNSPILLVGCFVLIVNEVTFCPLHSCNLNIRLIGFFCRHRNRLIGVNFTFFKLLSVLNFCDIVLVISSNHHSNICVCAWDNSCIESVRTIHFASIFLC